MIGTVQYKMTLRCCEVLPNQIRTVNMENSNHAAENGNYNRTYAVNLSI